MKRKGGTARDCLKEAKSRPDEQKPDTRQHWPDERAGSRGRLRGLPQEICTVSFGTEGAARLPDRGAEVSKGRSRPLRWLKARSSGVS